MSQQIKQLEDRISRLEIDLKQMGQLVQSLTNAVSGAMDREGARLVDELKAVEAKRGPGRPKKEQQ